MGGGDCRGASAFIESTLAQVYKRSDGEFNYKGGPAYYVESALGSRVFGIIFAISLIFLSNDLVLFLRVCPFIF